MAANPTQRSLERARREGWQAGVVERWNSHARIRQDLFGFIDLVVLDGGSGPLAVQATSASNHASRRRKIVEERAEAAKAWLECGGRIEVWSFRKPKGSRLYAWRREPVELDDLA